MFEANTEKKCLGQRPLFSDNTG